MSGSLRGRYLPHGFLPSFTGAPFRDHCFHFPLICTVDREDPHVVQLHNVVEGTLIRTVDLDRLAQACALPERPFQASSSLLDIDVCDDYLCAAFDTAVLIMSIYEPAEIASSATVSSAVLFEEDVGPFQSQQTAQQLAKLGQVDVTKSHISVLSGDPIVTFSCNGESAMESHRVTPPSKKHLEESSRALVHPGARGSSFFISGMLFIDACTL